MKEARDLQQNAARLGSDSINVATIIDNRQLDGDQKQAQGVYGAFSEVGALMNASASRTLELLAPAKDLAIGQAAILAGADAVYIGGPSFGARAAAGNSMEDLATLCAFAHRFGARVYLTLNTLLYNEELSEVERLIAQARDVGVDALIIQDVALLGMNSLKQMEIHASTQMNIDSLAKVDFCRAWNFSQIVLPREFSLKQIREFCQNRPDIRFEVFVAGAMCVSVSGICYISEMMTGRSANRGACAQICRLPMTLYQRQSLNSSRERGNVGNSADTDKIAGVAMESLTAKTALQGRNAIDADANRVFGEGQNGSGLVIADIAKIKEIAHGHLLSMKDNLRLAQLEDLVLAGAVSFKIEGRLKDRDYVVNQVSAFRERLDQIIAKYPALYKRASLGICHHAFKPDLCKTFNRGFTSNYLQGDNSALVNARTPKNLGEELGIVKSIKELATYACSQNVGPQQGQRQKLGQQQGRNDSKGKQVFIDPRYGHNHRLVKTKGRKLATIKDAKSESAMKAREVAVHGEFSCCIALQLKTACTLNNGDSFAFFTPKAELTGFRVNRISITDTNKEAEVRAGFAHGTIKQGVMSAHSEEADSSKLSHGVTVPAKTVVYLYVPKAVDGLSVGAMLYRNVDTLFIKELNRPQAITRQVPLKALIAISSTEFSISFADAYGRSATKSLALPFSVDHNQTVIEGQKQGVISAESTITATTTGATTTTANNSTTVSAIAANAEQASIKSKRTSELVPLKREVVIEKLTKLGSPYVTLSAEDVSIHGDLSLAKLPLSVFNQLRRQAFMAYEKVVGLTRMQALALRVPYLDSPDGTSATLYKMPKQDAAAKLRYPETVLDQRLMLNHCSQEFYQHGKISLEGKQQAITRVGNADSGAVSEVTSDGDGIGKTAALILSSDVLTTTTTTATTETQKKTKIKHISKATVTTSPLSPSVELMNKAVMTCRHCLIKEHALCYKEGGKTSNYFLHIGKFDFDIVTDCRKCLMYLVPHQDHSKQD